MEKKQLTIKPNYIIRCFSLLIVLSVIAIGLYGYNYTDAYVMEKKHAVNTIANALQKRINNYRYLTNKIYEKFGYDTSQLADANLQETRLHPDIYYIDSQNNKTDAMIFGSHDRRTMIMIANISDFLSARWGSKTEKTEHFSMYYLNGQDNSLSLVTTQSLKEQTSRLKDSHLTTSILGRRAEMLQHANILDEQESFSGLRQPSFQDTYSFSLLTTFNQPGHLATVIAFELPINDIIPRNMHASSFLLLHNKEIDNQSALETKVNITLKRSWVEFSISLANAPLKLVYRIPFIDLIISLLHNNIWLLVINLLLLILSSTCVYFIRKQYICPRADIATELMNQRTLNQEIITHLSSGVLVYDFINNTVITSNLIADHLLPHLSLQKIVYMAEQRHGVIQVTINNEIYEIQSIRSQLSSNAYLFIMKDQDKEIIMNKRLNQAHIEYDKSVQARKLMLHNLSLELNQPVRQIHHLAEHFLTQPDKVLKQELCKQLRFSSSSILGLIDNITLLTRLETKDWQSSYQLFSPSALIDRLLLETLPAINQKGLLLFNHFHLDFDQKYFGDANSLYKVISLLLHYSVITTSYGKISLTVEHATERPEQLIFHINDTGSGISSQEIGNLTYPFINQAQADRFNQGSGLTLFLCSQLCEKMNGQLEISSKVDIGTAYTFRVTMEKVKQVETQSNLLSGITVLLDITSKEVRNIVTLRLNAYGATCLIIEDNYITQNYDLLLTDNPQQTGKYTLLLDSNEMGWKQLNKLSIRVNYNLNGAMLNAILMLVKQKKSAQEQSTHMISLTNEDIFRYQDQLRTTGYYSLFITTVPADIKKLYNLVSNRDLSTLSKTTHRLKGVFAMLDLLPGKQFCELLEQHIIDGDVLRIENEIGQIDFFVSRLLQQGNQQYE